MTNPYRAELQLLFDAAESFTEPALGHHRPWAAALNRARALLDQPEPEGPTDEELMSLAVSVFEDWNATDKDYARAVLARWGRPTPQPVAVSERLPGPEDCDEQGRCWLLTVEDEYPQWRLHSIEGAQPGGAMIWVPVDSSPGVMVDCFYTSHWLPANALPTPEATND